jgi:hypothetical protein
MFVSRVKNNKRCSYMANLRYVHDGDCEPGNDVIQNVLLPVILWQPAQDGNCKARKEGFPTLNQVIQH